MMLIHWTLTSTSKSRPDATSESIFPWGHDDKANPKLGLSQTRLIIRLILYKNSQRWILDQVNQRQNQPQTKLNQDEANHRHVREDAAKFYVLSSSHLAQASALNSTVIFQQNLQSESCFRLWNIHGQTTKSGANWRQSRSFVQTKASGDLLSSLYLLYIEKLWSEGSGPNEFVSRHNLHSCCLKVVARRPFRIFQKQRTSILSFKFCKVERHCQL